MLSPAATLGKHQLGEARDPPGGRLQCLRCGHEFKPEEPRSGLDGEEGWRPLFRKTGTSPALDLPTHVPPAASGRMVLRWEWGGGALGQKGAGTNFSAWRKN